MIGYKVIEFKVLEFKVLSFRFKVDTGDYNLVIIGQTCEYRLYV